MAFKSIAEAAEAIVKENLVLGTKFSAWDVTHELRRRAAVDPKGFLDIDDTVHMNGVEVPNIGHDVVRGAVHGLFDAGEMSGWDRTHNGAFFEYAPATPTLPPLPVSTPGCGGPGKPYDGSPTLK